MASTATPTTIFVFIKPVAIEFFGHYILHGVVPPHDAHLREIPQQNWAKHLRKMGWSSFSGGIPGRNATKDSVISNGVTGFDVLATCTNVGCFKALTGGNACAIWAFFHFLKFPLLLLFLVGLVCIEVY